MTKKLFKKHITKNQIDWLVGFLVLLSACLLFWTWYTQSYLKPSNVFWGTIGNNLSVNFVTRTSTKSEGSQKLTQVNDLQFKPVLIARSTVKIENTATKEKVTTETIGTTTTDYLRYVEITTNGSSNVNKSILGVWAKHQATKDVQPQVLSESLLSSVLMFGNLSSTQRKDIMDQLQSTGAFQKYNLIAKKTVNGHSIYTFDVTMNLEAYGKIYANYLKMLGQDKLAEQIGQQQPGSTYSFILDVNAGSRVPTQLSVTGSSDTETYSNVGSGPRFIAPQATISIADLQAKLSGK